MSGSQAGDEISGTLTIGQEIEFDWLSLHISQGLDCNCSKSERFQFVNEET